MDPKNKTPQPDPNDEKKRRDAMRRMANFGLSYLIVSLVGLWLFQQFILAPLAIQAADIRIASSKQNSKPAKSRKSPSAIRISWGR